MKLGAGVMAEKELNGGWWLFCWQILQDHLRLPWLEVQDELPRTRCEDSPSLVQAYADARKLE